MSSESTIDGKSTTLHARNNGQLRSPIPPTESTALLGSQRDEQLEVPEVTWKSECALIARYSTPLLAISVLDYSQTLFPVLVAGHLGSSELGAVSLASMTARLTGYSIYQGLATALDTLCGQAYGKGHRDLIGLYVQKMALCLLLTTIPIGLLWFFATPILKQIVPETETAAMAGLYLKVLIAGAPGYACFESGRRYTQSKGQFAAILYTFLCGLGLNVATTYCFVWSIHMGFLGSAVATVITQTMLPILLFLFTWALHGCEDWPPLRRKVLDDWSTMLYLAIPGSIMVLADTIAFEALSFASAQLGGLHLAANMVVLSVNVLAYRIPTAIAIATATRIAHLVGAGSQGGVRRSMRVAFGIAAFTGSLSGGIMVAYRMALASLFTPEHRVIQLAAEAFLVVGPMQVIDTIVCQCEGILRGIGRQRVGAHASSSAYVVIGVPTSLGLCFGLSLELLGLWSGLTLALSVLAIFLCVYLAQVDIDTVVDDSGARLSRDTEDPH